MGLLQSQVAFSFSTLSEKKAEIGGAITNGNPPNSPASKLKGRKDKMEAAKKRNSDNKSAKSNKKDRVKSENSSEYFNKKPDKNSGKHVKHSVQRRKTSKQRDAQPKDKPPKASACSSKTSSAKIITSSANAVNSKENADSDSDFDGEPVLSQQEKLNISQSSTNIDSSSESDFEEVDDGPSTSTAGNNQLAPPHIDISKLSQEDFNISMLAKFEGVNLEPTMEQDSDDSDWEEVKGIIRTIIT